MSLRGDWSCQSPAERVNHGREATVGLRWLLEVLPHQGGGVASQQRELLVLRHGVVAGAEKLRCDLTIVVGLAVAASG